MSSLIPNRSLVDFEFLLTYKKRMPALDGTLRGWTDDCLLPPLCLLDDQSPFAAVWACWNTEGLFLACRVNGKESAPQCDPKVFWRSDHLRVCTDTRDTRANKRATRYCQQFHFLPTGGGKNGKEPYAGSANIHRAREDAPLFSSSTGSTRIQIAARGLADGYQLEAHVPAKCLIGFDPSEHSRIGFFYIVEDREFDPQFFTVGDELKWYINPSTWATAVLAR